MDEHLRTRRERCCHPTTTSDAEAAVLDLRHAYYHEGRGDLAGLLADAERELRHAHPDHELLAGE